MKKFHCVDITFKTSFSEVVTYHAHLYLTDNKIVFEVHSDIEFSSNFLYWFGQNKDSDNISDFMSMKVAENQSDLLEINLEGSKIIGLTSEQFDDFQRRYFTITLNQITLLKKPNEETEEFAKIYLNEDGFDLVKNYYSVFTGFNNDGQFDIKRMRGMDDFYKLGNSLFRPEFEFKVSDSKNSKTPKIEKIPIIKFKFNKDVSETEIYNYLDIACKICSFYLGNNIEYSFAVISLEKYRIIVQKTLESKFKLDISSLNWLLNIKGIHEFLKLDWQNKYLQNQEKIDKAITNYTHSRLLDSNSKFMLLYNIIDICMSGYKPNSEKFKIIVSKKQKIKHYEDALSILKTTVNENDYDDFSIKWDSVVKLLINKPMKSTLEEFFRENKIEHHKMDISIAKMKSIRDEIFHGRVSKDTSKLIQESNIQLYRITPILILNILEIEIWKTE